MSMECIWNINDLKRFFLLWNVIRNGWLNVFIWCQQKWTKASKHIEHTHIRTKYHENTIFPLKKRESIGSIERSISNILFLTQSLLSTIFFEFHIWRFINFAPHVELLSWKFPFVLFFIRCIEKNAKALFTLRSMCLIFH